MVELMVVLVIIGILVLLALPKLEPIVTKAKTTEAKLMLKQVYTLEKSYKYENDRFSASIDEIGFEQDKLVTDGGRARYKIEIVSADEKGFVAQATAVVDFKLGVHREHDLFLRQLSRFFLLQRFNRFRDFYLRLRGTI